MASFIETNTFEFILDIILLKIGKNDKLRLLALHSIFFMN